VAWVRGVRGAGERPQGHRIELKTTYYNQAVKNVKEAYKEQKDEGWLFNQ